MAQWKQWYGDGKLLRFDRLNGTNQLFTGQETAHLRQVAPRSIQLALTNACNKDCGFCYRPLKARSQWTYPEVVDFFQFCSEWGVLEIAFGGGEPTLFPRFAELIRELWDTTDVCPNITTHGLNLSRQLLDEIHGHYGQIQLSVYDEDPTLEIIALLKAAEARFGLNYLITPKRARTLEVDIEAFVRAGVRDFLFLSYKGTAPDMHLSEMECAMFDESVHRMHERYGHQVGLKVDVCWANRLKQTPQLMYEGGDCLANDDFISVSSDKKLLACSFHGGGGEPFDSFADLRQQYTSMRGKHMPAPSPGCARLPGHGFTSGLVPLQRLLDRPQRGAKNSS